MSVPTIYDYIEATRRVADGSDPLALSMLARGREWPASPPAAPAAPQAAPPAAAAPEPAPVARQETLL